MPPLPVSPSPMPSLPSRSSPLISVLMPVYNADRYLAQAIESILQQSFTQFEFLIVNDGSTDRSADILERYAQQDARIRLYHQPNQGLVKTLNFLLQQAQSELVARMDADDIALPDRFQYQYHYLQANPATVCVGGAHGLIDAQGRYLTFWEMPEENDEIQALALRGHTPINHPCVMMRRSAVLQAGGYNPALLPCEDLDLWLRLGEVGKLANLRRTVLNYRLHSNSLSEQNQQLQRQKAQEACEQAWQRRGITGQFDATSPWRPTADRRSQHQFMLQYGWWAFNSRERQTACWYGIRAIEKMPFRADGWRLLACAMLKPMPAPTLERSYETSAESSMS